MAEAFDEIRDLIIQYREDLSRLDHASDVKGKALKPMKVAGMSDLDLMQLISDEAEKRLAANGINPNAVEFYSAVAKTFREIRGKVPRQ